MKKQNLVKKVADAKAKHIAGYQLQANHHFHMSKFDPRMEAEDAMEFHVVKLDEDDVALHHSKWSEENHGRFQALHKSRLLFQLCVSAGTCMLDAQWYWQRHCSKDEAPFHSQAAHFSNEDNFEQGGFHFDIGPDQDERSSSSARNIGFMLRASAGICMRADQWYWQRYCPKYEEPLHMQDAVEGYIEELANLMKTDVDNAGIFLGSFASFEAYEAEVMSRQSSARSIEVMLRKLESGEEHLH